MMNGSAMSPSPSAGTPLDLSGICQTIGGYRSVFGGAVEDAPDVTTDEYAANQEKVNTRKTVDYLLPRVKSAGARSVLDVGCGVGAMVRTFLDLGYDAYGVDLPGLHRHWTRLSLPQERMFIVDPEGLRLPFADGSLDFVYTLGVIEHVGTSNGHSDRLPDYHARRKQWLREVFRVVRPGGVMLVAGPNRGFPVDVAHDLDSRASGVERWLSTKLRVSVHKTWGENFLWSYADLNRYLEGLSYRLDPQPIAGFLACSRVPRPVRPMVQAYVDHLPKWLHGTGFNPWVMALVHKPAPAADAVA
ncbi:putative S-adenosylmethionine-dependent methyltransferase/MSMEI_2290 [Burkholderiaceae bacterium]|nr:putative S-adenosylmethionine-dependent methyltransferase/MSMEI_2290 [Burkholderiaceae bacterium]